MTTKAALLKLEKLHRFLAAHTIRDKYIVCVFKCGHDDCEFNCGELRMPRAAFNELIGDRLKASCKLCHIQSTRSRAAVITLTSTPS